MGFLSLVSAILKLLGKAMQTSPPPSMNGWYFPSLAIHVTLCAKITFLRELWWVAELTQALVGTLVLVISILPFLLVPHQFGGTNQQEQAQFGLLVSMQSSYTGGKCHLKVFSVLEKLCSCATYHRIIFSVVKL